LVQYYWTDKTNESLHSKERSRWKQLARRTWCLFKKGLRPYAGLLSFVGVCIVLGTFIVKDVLRDQQKDLVSALDTARLTWQFSQNVNSLDWRIMELEDKFNELTLVNRKFTGP
jgi:hypothetical protein